MTWKSVKDELPKKNGKYLCVVKGWLGGDSHIELLGFHKNLYKLDEYDFDHYKFRKDKSGFYDFDSEWGYRSEEDVTHWMPIPEMPKE